jgi:photosystem II stability/assembly factor-like uncharacterized protein
MTTPTPPAPPQTIEPAGGQRGVRRRVFPLLMVLLAGVVVAGVGMWRSRDGAGSDQGAVAAGNAFVGGDLHAVAVAGDRRFVSGHAGAAYSDRSDSWVAVRGLEGKDGMGWASLAGRTLVGGHQGLYVSTDAGVTFSSAPVDLPVTDVHALGGSGQTVYLASPETGMFVSTDAGKTFTQRSAAGRSFMGTILVDPDNPAHAIAPDMATDVTETLDGGRTWQSLGGPQGAMSVAWDPRNRARLAAVGADGVMVSTDAGQSWQRINAPTGTAAATFDGQGGLLAATLVGDHARLQRSVDSGATWSAA